MFDDTLVEKAYREEHEIICWYYDPSNGRNIQGIHMLTGFYGEGNGYGKLHIPIDYHKISKITIARDEKTGKGRRVREKS